MKPRDVYDFWSGVLLGFTLLFIVITLMSCAAPRGDAKKTYEQLLNVYCFAPNCKVNVTVTTSVAADVKKDQKADARADISPTLDIAP